MIRHRTWFLAPLAATIVPALICSAESIRIATFNTSLNRSSEGQLAEDLATPDDDQAAAVAEIIQRVNPDVILLNEFDYDESGVSLSRFQRNYLEVRQNGAGAVNYPFVYIAPSNTGVPSVFDFDNNGSIGGGNDAFGFGNFPGQFGMAVLSKFPILTGEARTFQTFLWKDLPDADLPDNPDTPEPGDFYSPQQLEAFRLSSKSHWDLPINIHGQKVHLLASHPTPPVFDGPEDRNGKRNADEIRFWNHYITPESSGFVYDDADAADSPSGGLAEGASFVIAGDLNNDPFDGDGTHSAINNLLANVRLNASFTPSSAGAAEDSMLEGQANETHLGDPAHDTADFNPASPGNLRADYVLPSTDLEVIGSGVFWPEQDDPLSSLTGNFPFPSSDHRLVYVDVHIVPEPATIGMLSLSLATALFIRGVAR